MRKPGGGAKGAISPPQSEGADLCSKKGETQRVATGGGGGKAYKAS